MSTPTIPKGNDYFDAVTRNGFGSAGGSVTSLNFQPDFWWEKARNTASNHTLIDSIRGVTKELYSNLTNAESTGSNFLTSFNSNGFTMGSNDWGTSTTLVDWVWKAGGTAVSNTSGTITSSVSANTTSGFSVVTWTGTGSNGSVGHGLGPLGIAPQFIIVKGRNVGSTNWFIYTAAQGATKYLDFSTGTGGTDSSAWNNTAPTATVFSVGTSYYTNYAATTYVAYCWAPIAGYSQFGSYTGNGSTDGPFIYTGFRPRFVMIKRTDSSDDWIMMDSSRSTYNVAILTLYANGNYAEDSNVTNRAEDFLSNGFKIRSSPSYLNASGGTYIYMAFAENPFKYANAR